MKNKTQTKKNIGLPFMICAFILILVISLLDGPIFSFVNAIQHIYSDLTINIKVHAYIVGLVLLLYGIYRRYANR